MEDQTIRFILKTFKDQKDRKTSRVNIHRANLKPEKGGLGIMDIKLFWMSAKIGWLRRLLQKEYNEMKRKKKHT